MHISLNALLQYMGACGHARNAPNELGSIIQFKWRKKYLEEKMKSQDQLKGVQRGKNVWWQSKGYWTSFLLGTVHVLFFILILACFRCVFVCKVVYDFANFTVGPRPCVCWLSVASHISETSKAIAITLTVTVSLSVMRMYHISFFLTLSEVI